MKFIIGVIKGIIWALILWPLSMFLNIIALIAAVGDSEEALKVSDFADKIQGIDNSIQD